VFHIRRTDGTIDALQRALSWTRKATRIIAGSGFSTKRPRRNLGSILNSRTYPIAWHVRVRLLHRVINIDGGFRHRTHNHSKTFSKLLEAPSR